MNRKWILAALPALSLGLAGCGGGGSGSDSATPGANTGTVSVAATDAPVDDVERVQITFNRIELQPASGERLGFDFEPPVVIENLLDFQGTDATLLLEDTEVPAGEYNFLRLFIVPNIPDSFVDVDGGGRGNLLIPGQQGNGNANNRFLQLGNGFIVPAGGNVDFTIDIELRKALVQAPGQGGDYFLRPSLRLIDNSQVGVINGTVDATQVNDASCSNDLNADEGNAVYLYSGADAAIGDVNIDVDGNPDHDTDDADGNTSEVNPLTIANVVQNGDTGDYEYTIGFVSAGEYSIAFTCQSLNDEVESDEDLLFVMPQNLTVAAGQTTTANFGPVTAPPPVEEQE